MSPARQAFTIALLAVSPPVSAQQADPEWTPAHALEIRRVGPVAVSPNGEQVAFAVGTFVSEGTASELRRQIHVERASRRETRPSRRETRPSRRETRPVTMGEHSSYAPAWSPDGTWIAFLTTRSGTANVWRMRSDGSQAEQLTSGRGRVVGFKWSPGGSQLAYLAVDPPSPARLQAERERRDARVHSEQPRMTRLYVMDVTGETPRPRTGQLLTPGEYSVSYPIFSFGSLFDWDAEGNRIVFTHQPTPSANDWPQSDISVVDVTTGAVAPVAATSASEWSVRFSPDGRWIAYAVSDDPPTWGFTYRVHVIPADGGDSRRLADTFDRKPTIVGWSSDSQNVLTWEPRGTAAQLSMLPLDGGPSVDVPISGDYLGRPTIDRAGQHGGVTVESPTQPPEAFVWREGTFAATQVSQVQPALPPVARTEVISWRSPDGRLIEGLLTHPRGVPGGDPAPLLVIAHGGPTGVFNQSFIGRSIFYPVAAFAAKGFAVLRPNVRGGSGYGHDFRYANYHDWGGGDFEDLMSGVDALIERGVADSERLGIMGWSYGGFMASWALTQTDRFRAASVGAGMSELVSFTGTTDLPDFVPDYLGPFYDDFEPWRSRSPVLNLHRGIRTPTLVQHGELDERVPHSQGLQLYRALQALDIPSRMVTYPRQGHVVTEPKLMLDVLEENLAWFERWIPAGVR